MVFRGLILNDYAVSSHAIIGLMIVWIFGFFFSISSLLRMMLYFNDYFFGIHVSLGDHSVKGKDSLSQCATDCHILLQNVPGHVVTGDK